ncbi:MAG: hypothetical protein FJ267_12010, partial [Planctomycetes bacterium]|nr:hypothetical protein [Planctomycetota bacterium]
GTVAFDANETSKTITINVSGDSTHESDETFAVMLTNPSPGVRFDTSLLPGLVSWYRAEGDGIDSVGDNHGTLTNGTSTTPGRLGKAFSFDGIDDDITVADSPTLNPTSAITVEAWINRTSHVGQFDPIVKKAGEGTAIEHGYTLEFDGNDVLFYVYVDGIGWTGSQRATVPLGTWTHVAGVYDGSVIRLFVNGTQVGTDVSAPGSIVPSGNPLKIGGDPYDSARHFHGLIDDVRIHNQALSGSELNASLSDFATGTITNDDSIISMASANVSLVEGHSGTTPFEFTVTRTGSITGTTTVEYAVIGSGISAANVADFGGNLPTGTVSFAANETSKTITIDVTGDSIAEADETFTVTLSNPSPGTTIAVPSTTGTIRNDDSSLSVVPNVHLTNPPAGFVAWWTGDDTTHDSIGSNDGELINGATYAPGKFGDGFRTTGPGSQVRVPYSPSQDISPTGFTAAFWMKGGVQPGELYNVLDKSHGGGSGWTFQSDFQNGKLAFIVGTGGGF